MSESANTPSASSSSQQPQVGENNNNNNNNKGIIDTEESLRNQLRNSMQAIKRREPLDPKYKKLLLGGIVTNRKPTLSKDKFYKRIGSNLRNRVERFMEQTAGKDPFDNILSRQPLEEESMRAALTLREHKKHEQKALLDATIASIPRGRNGMDAMSRKRELDCIALGLQQVEVIRLTNHNKPAAATAGIIGSSTTTSMSQKDELDQRKVQAKAREEARKQREQEVKQKAIEEEEKKRKRKVDTPQQALHKLYQPIFQKLWEMEFPLLGNINPFRLVIDKESCTSLGAPDYFDIIDIPMNLTYIQNKVDNMEYISLGSFFNDVDLMIQNALKYNTAVDNPYHIAANEMKLIAQRVIKTLQQKKKQKQELQAQKELESSSR